MYSSTHVRLDIFSLSRSLARLNEANLRLASAYITGHGRYFGNHLATNYWSPSGGYWLQTLLATVMQTWILYGEQPRVEDAGVAGVDDAKSSCRFRVKDPGTRRVHRSR